MKKRLPTRIITCAAQVIYLQSPEGEIMKHIVKFSGGKDSTAMLLMMLERGLPVDEIIFCDTGLEYPEVYEHIQAVEKFTGRQITVLHPPHTFEYFLADIVKTKGEHAGEHGYGWTRRKDQRWCTGQLKEKVAARYLKNAGEYTLYIGIAADEPSRHYRETAKNIRHLLFEWGITEKMALEYCQSKGFDFGGLYKKFNRLGCWCCPFQTKKVLRILRRDYPALWQEMQRLDSKAPNTFKIGRSIAQYERCFALEDKQIKLFGNYLAHKASLCDLNIDEVKQHYIKYAVQKRKKSDMKKLQGGLF